MGTVNAGAHRPSVSFYILEKKLKNSPFYRIF